MPLFLLDPGFASTNSPETFQKDDNLTDVFKVFQFVTETFLNGENITGVNGTDVNGTGVVEDGGPLKPAPGGEFEGFKLFMMCSFWIVIVGFCLAACAVAAGNHPDAQRSMWADQDSPRQTHTTQPQREQIPLTSFTPV